MATLPNLGLKNDLVTFVTEAILAAIFKISRPFLSERNKNPINPTGTAILVPGQYRSTWKLGRHQRKYEALVQRKPVKVWRDNNQDEIIDYNNIELLSEEGYFGINIHRSNPYDQSYVVNRWSAGCQVFKKVEDYNNFMELCKESAKIYGNSFTYTLITEKELRNHLNS